MDINPIITRGAGALGQRLTGEADKTLDASVNSESQTAKASASALQNITSASKVSASADLQVVGDNIDISEYGKSMLDRFKDLPISDSVKNFIQNQFNNFESAVGGAADMFKASIGITAAEMTMEDGSVVEYLEVSIQMFAVSVQTLGEQVQTPSQSDFLHDQMSAALELAKEQMEEMLKQIEETRRDGMLNMIDEAFKTMKNTLDEVTGRTSSPENV